jgi:hypothetical protein
MADWYKGQVIIRGSLEAMSYFVKDNFYDDTVTKFDNNIKLESLPNYFLSEEYGLVTIERTEKAENANEKHTFDIKNIGDAFGPSSHYKINIHYDEGKNVCWMQMNMDFRYGIDVDAFLDIAKKYKLDFKISCADWNEGLVEKVTIVKGKLIEDEEYSYYDDNIDDVFFEKL